MNKLIVNNKIINVQHKRIIIENNSIFVSNKEYVTNLNNSIILFENNSIIINYSAAIINVNNQYYGNYKIIL